MGEGPHTGGLLLVHAHPDDESINNGSTMAWYAARGVPVTVVTCTLGEAGEVIPPELGHLEGDHEALGEHRHAELREAMAALGVESRLLLDDDGATLRDSGMAYAPDGSVVPSPSTPPDAFAKADLADLAELLDKVLAELRPAVVVTYEPGGGYGHPDHVRAAEVTMAAVELAAGRGRAPSKVYEIVVPVPEQKVLLAGIGEDPERPLSTMYVPQEQVTTRVDGDERSLATKLVAMRAHATQLVVESEKGWYALSNGIRWPLSPKGWFRLVRGEPGPLGPDGVETDLFAGLPWPGTSR